MGGYINLMRKFGEALTRILANPNIKPLAKIVLRNELERYISRSKGGKPRKCTKEKVKNLIPV